MNVGFGSTEADFEAAEESAFREKFRDACASNNAGYVTDELVMEMRQWVALRASLLRKAADDYKSAEEYPDRYSSYRVTVLNDANHIVAIMRFTHINRRHAMSPDGWGAMWTNRCFFVHVNEPEKL